MTATVHLDDATTLETVDVVVSVDADPTGATPQFCVVAAGASISGASWQNGSWVTDWSAARKRATARTPAIGASGTLVVAAGTAYDLWWRVTLLTETPVKLAARLSVAS